MADWLDEPLLPPGVEMPAPGMLREMWVDGYRAGQKVAEDRIAELEEDDDAGTGYIPTLAEYLGITHHAPVVTDAWELMCAFCGRNGFEMRTEPCEPRGPSEMVGFTGLGMAPESPQE